MELTQEAITSDWRGDNLYSGETYLVVDHDTTIADYVDEIQAFLETNYQGVVYEYKPYAKDEWLECLSDCTTTPEKHVANEYGEIKEG